MKSIAVYCGSNSGKDNAYHDSVIALANALVEENITLIYGGAKVGLMGVLADNVIGRNGKAIGVIPESLLDVEIAHDNLSKLHVVKTMHERKKLMCDLADGFILMPGGSGSLDEFFEIFTWLQLGYIAKPCGIFNIGNYFNHLINFLNHAVSENFIRNEHMKSIAISSDPNNLINSFKNFVPLHNIKWVKELSSPDASFASGEN